MDEPLPNPELVWHLEQSCSAVDPEEVRTRVGCQPEEIVALSGGLANDNLRINRQHVLRIYRRDVQALPIERELLDRRWSSFRVPRVLAVGHDHLVLEYVAHEPLLASRSHGWAVGKALREIHKTRFSHAGSLGPDLTLAEPWKDFLHTMVEYVRAQAGVDRPHQVLMRRVARHLERRATCLRPHGGQPVLLHGDFKASNLHWSDDDRLLVLDWEFAYAGPAWMDLGQLCRWGLPAAFAGGFTAGYGDGEAPLPQDWQRLARCFDLVNLIGLLAKSPPASRQQLDCTRGIETVLED